MKNKTEVISMEKRVSIQKAAKIMGTSEQYIRIGLRNNRFPFGSAVKLSTQWTYHISPKPFYEYIGVIEKEKEERNSEINNLSIAGEKYYTLYM